MMGRRLHAGILAIGLTIFAWPAAGRAEQASTARFSLIGGSPIAWIAARPHLQPNTMKTYATPPEQVRAFQAFATALAAGNWQMAARLAVPLGYTIGSMQAGAARLVVAFEDSGRDATIIINSAPRRDVVFQAPHAPFEAGTAEQAVLLMLATEGRAAIVAGAHRCASQTFAGCSGSTEVCGQKEAYRDSDVGHYTGTFFQAAHQAFAAVWPRSVAVSLHGMEEDRVGPKTSIIVSTGAHGMDVDLQYPATRLRSSLGRLPVPAGTVVSCNLPSDEVFGYRKLCGFTNVQGRFINRSVDICSASTETTTGRFVHIEQDWTVLQPFSQDWQNLGRYPLANSLVPAFAATMPMIDRR